MNPEVMPQGTSFKGGHQYYGHDPRQEGEAERTTKDRVGFTYCGNLPTSDPDKAWKCMAWTAKNQTALKKASGQKTTGRKMKKPVYTYVLPWHPEENPTEQEMKEAVRETLAVLKFEEHEFVVYEHTDRPHPHVHVMVNRCHPVTGMDGDISNDWLKLSEWAEAYNKKRGKNYCPQRAINNARRRKGEFVRGSTPKKNRRIQHQPQAQETAKQQADQKRHQQLSQISVQHAKELADLKAQAQASIDDRKQQLADTYRDRWNELYDKQRSQKDAGNREKERLGGRLKEWLGKRLEKARPFLPFWLQTAKAQRASNQDLEKKHETERTDLAKHYRAELKEAVATEKQRYSQTLLRIETRHQITSPRPTGQPAAPASREQFLKSVIDRQKAPANDTQKQPEPKRIRGRDGDFEL